MIESGFEEIRSRAPWPAEAGEQTLNAESSQPNDDDRATVKAGPEIVRFQGMRVAYFCVDRESTEDSLILNRIVSLKEDTGKE